MRPTYERRPVAGAAIAVVFPNGNGKTRASRPSALRAQARIREPHCFSNSRRHPPAMEAAMIRPTLKEQLRSWRPNAAQHPVYPQLLSIKTQRKARQTAVRRARARP